jgi:hypothetical protein
VADCNLFWIEEPFDEHREGLMRLKEHMNKVDCKAYIADGEGRTGSGPRSGDGATGVRGPLFA